MSCKSHGTYLLGKRLVKLDKNTPQPDLLAIVDELLKERAAVRAATEPPKA